MTTECQFELRKLPSDWGEDCQRDVNVIDTVVIHSMYALDYPNPYSIFSCKEVLDEEEVSAHYLIDREGVVWQLVPEERRAWHAGKLSQMPDGRTGVNMFSVGIELLGTKESGFTDKQYETLVLLTTDISNRRNIKCIVGHSDIAGPSVRPKDPKTDPWNFDWDRFRTELAEVANTEDLITFGPHIYS